ncbi:hypothetical protein K457DRAFT_140665 [Linnemannia elongata AG-77]|uniref:Uncharacterized protein n=1 Tax=Linnemannia elongata AG-77 TaxID=1314771 RepID=A0A197JNM7_9FUNG|nr:hypothetical protein K457DRAFT_140665 [Linnemannia elongata AG-77]
MTRTFHSKSSPFPAISFYIPCFISSRWCRGKGKADIKKRIDHVQDRKRCKDGKENEG